MGWRDVIKDWWHHRPWSPETDPEARPRLERTERLARELKSLGVFVDAFRDSRTSDPEEPAHD